MACLQPPHQNQHYGTRLESLACPHQSVAAVLPRITQAWTSMFRPETLAHICGHAHLKHIIRMHACQQLPPPCMLWHGPPGVGKTSMARALITHYKHKEDEACHASPSTPPLTQNIQTPTIHVLELNASERRNHSDVSSAIGDRINALTHVKDPTLQFFIVDECDAMTVPAQVGLAKLIEDVHQRNQNPQLHVKIGIVAMCNDFERIHWRLRLALLVVKFNLMQADACHKWLVSRLRNLLCPECWPQADHPSTWVLAANDGHQDFPLHRWVDIDTGTFQTWAKAQDVIQADFKPPLDMRHMLMRAQAHVQSLAVAYIEQGTSPNPPTPTPSRINIATQTSQQLISSLQQAFGGPEHIHMLKPRLNHLHRAGIDNIQLAQRLLQSNNALEAITNAATTMDNTRRQPQDTFDYPAINLQTPAMAVLDFVTRTQSMAVIPDIYMYHLMGALSEP